MHDRYYWHHDYHKVKIVGLEKDLELDWKSYEFMYFCKLGGQE